MEILFAEQIKTIAANPAKQCVQETRGKRAAREISEGPRDCHACHARAPRPAFGKALRIPSEKSNRAQGAKFEQGAFYSPIRNFAGLSGRQDTLRIGSGLCHKRAYNERRPIR